MIGSIRGKIIESTLDSCLIEASSGVGYRLYVTTDTAASIFDKIGNEVFFYTHTIVREDVLDLYGFESKNEQELFEKIISVSGVGPKSGLAVLSIAPIDQLKAAIASGDTDFLTKVSGIGKKSAQKIILELQDKLADEALSAQAPSNNYTIDNEVLDALIALGYNQNQARRAIKEIDPNIVGTEERLRAALKILA